MYIFDILNLVCVTLTLILNFLLVPLMKFEDKKGVVGIYLESRYQAQPLCGGTNRPNIMLHVSATHYLSEKIQYIHREAVTHTRCTQEEALDAACYDSTLPCFALTPHTYISTYQVHIYQQHISKETIAETIQL